MNRARSLVLACLIGTAAACGSDDPLITPPTPTLFTEVFSGTLSPGGGQTFTFIAQSSGRVTVTVTALAPNSTSILGLSLGTAAGGGACQVVISNDTATQQTALVGSVGSAGNLCVRVYDPAAGVVVEPLTFDLTVVHP